MWNVLLAHALVFSYIIHLRCSCISKFNLLIYGVCRRCSKIHVTIAWRNWMVSNGSRVFCYALLNDDAETISALCICLHSFSKFDRRRHFACEPCAGPVRGGYDAKHNQVCQFSQTPKLRCFFPRKCKIVMKTVQGLEFIFCFCGTYLAYWR